MATCVGRHWTGRSRGGYRRENGIGGITTCIGQRTAGHMHRMDANAVSAGHCNGPGKSRRARNLIDEQQFNKIRLLQWHYKCADLRPWDQRNDLRQYESNFQILTKTTHVAPIVRTASIINSEPIILQADSRSTLVAAAAVAHRKKGKRLVLGSRKISSPELVDETDSSNSTAGRMRGGSNAK